MDEIGDKKQKIQPHHIHISALLIAVIILSLAVVLLIKPSVDNYMLKKKFSQVGLSPENITAKLDEMGKENELIRSNLTAQAEIAAKLSAENVKMREDSLYLQNNISKLKADLTFKDNEYSNTLTQLEQNYNQSVKLIQFNATLDRQKYEDLQKEYDALHKSSGRSICCRQKVDDPTINSYDVISGKIICTSNGEFKLTC